MNDDNFKQLKIVARDVAVSFAVALVVVSFIVSVWGV